METEIKGISTKSMIKKKSWKEFRDSGLLLLVNQFLHVFGWSIVFEWSEDVEKEPDDVYVARVKFRGFTERSRNRVPDKVGIPSRDRLLICRRSRRGRACGDARG